MHYNWLLLKSTNLIGLLSDGNYSYYAYLNKYTRYLFIEILFKYFPYLKIKYVCFFYQTGIMNYKSFVLKEKRWTVNTSYFVHPTDLIQVSTITWAKKRLKKNFLSAILPGVNMLTRKFVLHGIKANFGIEDKNTLLAEVLSLQNGDYHAYEDLDVFMNLLDDEQKVLANKLVEMTKGRLIQGFDDCRIIDVITKAYAAKLINDNEFNEIFFAQAKRIEKDYDSWEQYLASCVLGKIVQMCDEAHIDSGDITFFRLQ